MTNRGIGSSRKHKERGRRRGRKRSGATILTDEKGSDDEEEDPDDDDDYFDRDDVKLTSVATVGEDGNVGE